VLAETADAVETLRDDEDNIDAHRIAEVISNDPLMTLKVLAFVGQHYGSRVMTDVETVTEALVLMGISPFFRAFGAQPKAEEWLAEYPEALSALLSATRTARYGANLALAFAVQRMDPDAATVHSASLLRDFANMLLWCHAPGLQAAIRTLQQANPDARSRAAQEQVLHIAVDDLQAVLARRWRLSELLAPTEAARHIEDARIRNVELAARLARHVARGWSDAAVTADIQEIAALLNLSVPATLELAQEI
jgi:HD-like signal output (HDOD) protein